MDRRAHRGHVAPAAGQRADQPVVAAAAGDLARHARALDFDLKDHAGVIFEMAPETGVEHDGRSAGGGLQPVEKRPGLLQRAAQLQLASANSASIASKRGGHLARDMQVVLDQPDRLLRQRRLARVGGLACQALHDLLRAARAQ